MTMKSLVKVSALFVLALAFASSSAFAALLTNPNDPRSWQGATVGTFAALYYGLDTPANRQLVIDNQLLDDGIFNSAGYSAATLIQGGGGCLGVSTKIGRAHV